MAGASFLWHVGRMEKSWRKVKATHMGGTVFAPGEEPKVKLHIGRLGRFVPARLVPLAAWEGYVWVRRRKGEWEFRPVEDDAGDGALR